MKKLIHAFSASILALQLLSVASVAQAAEVKEIKATYNNLTVNANLMMADGKTYSDPFVLINHGTLTNKDRSTYAHLQKNLAAQGISSLTFNLSLGLNDRQGEYDCAVPHTHKHTDALKEIDFWLNWLNKEGANNVAILGHSRGGNQVAWYANEHSHRPFNNVILLAPATGEQQSPEEYQSKYQTPVATVLKKAKDLMTQGKGDTLLKDTDFIYCENTQVTAEAFVDYYEIKPEFNTPTLLKSATKPTLVIMGSADTVVADLPEQMKQFEGSDRIQIVTIEDGDHFFLDFANEDVASAISDYLN